MRRERRIYHYILIILILVFALTNVTAIGIFSTHECQGEYCEICVSLREMRKDVDACLTPSKQTGSAAQRYIVVKSTFVKGTPLLFDNLISLKVKLAITTQFFLLFLDRSLVFVYFVLAER